MNIFSTVLPILLSGGVLGFSAQLVRNKSAGTKWAERKKHGMQLDTQDGKNLVINNTNVVLMGNGWEGLATELERVLRSDGDVQEITVIGKIGKDEQTICNLGKKEKQVRATGLWSNNIVWTGEVDKQGVSCFKEEN